MSGSFRAAVILVCGAVGLSSGLGAQAASPIHQGGWIIGGSASIGRAHDDVVGDRTHFGVAPTGLYFVTPRLALGGSVGLSYIDAPGGGSSYSYGVGPSARYYFASDTTSWLPFLSGTVMPSWTHQHFTTFTASGAASDVDVTVKSTSYDASAGLTRLLATHVGLTGEAYYNTNSQDANTASAQTHHSHDFGVRFGLTIFVH